MTTALDGGGGLFEIEDIGAAGGLGAAGGGGGGGAGT